MRTQYLMVVAAFLRWVGRLRPAAECIEVVAHLYQRTSPLTLSDGTELSAVDSTKNLGVTVTSTFKTSLHCRQAANRARRILFLLHRGFAVLTSEIFRPLYLILVRPILEYDQQASSPYLR